MLNVPSAIICITTQNVYRTLSNILALFTYHKIIPTIKNGYLLLNWRDFMAIHRFVTALVVLICIPLSSISTGDSKIYFKNMQNNIGTSDNNYVIQTSKNTVIQSNTLEPNINNTKNYLIGKYKNQIPHQWGEKVTGTKTHIITQQKIVALTFDACGGKHGSGYDSKLINYLIKAKVPATLFINSRWIDANYSTFITLSKNPLFEIENHGLLHKPLSVNGKSAWGISGTKNIGEVVDEVLLNKLKIQRITGRTPLYFRSGTDYYDEVAVKIARDLGQQVISYNVLGDAGATFNTEQVERACLSAKPGSIIILHMNHPEKYTAEGIIEAVPLLRKMGYRFVKLDDYYNYLK